MLPVKRISEVQSWNKIRQDPNIGDNPRRTSASWL